MLCKSDKPSIIIIIIIYFHLEVYRGTEVQRYSVVMSRTFGINRVYNSSTRISATVKHVRYYYDNYSNTNTNTNILICWNLSRLDS